MVKGIKIALIVLIIGAVFGLSYYLWKRSSGSDHGECPTGQSWECDTKTKTCAVVLGGKYPSQSVCQSICTADKRWTCTKGTCAVAADGTYKSQSECEAACIPPQWDCDHKNEACAIAADGTYKSQSECEAACIPPQWDCDHKNEACAIAADGTYKSQSECEAACIPPPSKKVCHADCGDDTDCAKMIAAGWEGKDCITCAMKTKRSKTGALIRAKTPLCDKFGCECIKL